MPAQQKSETIKIKYSIVSSQIIALNIWEVKLKMMEGQEPPTTIKKFDGKTIYIESPLLVNINDLKEGFILIKTKGFLTLNPLYVAKGEKLDIFDLAKGEKILGNVYRINKPEPLHVINAVAGSEYSRGILRRRTSAPNVYEALSEALSEAHQYASIDSIVRGNGSEADYQEAPSYIEPPEFLYCSQKNNPQKFTDNLRNTYTCSSDIPNISSGDLFQLQDVIEGKSTYNQIDSNIEFTVEFTSKLDINSKDNLLEKKKSDIFKDNFYVDTDNDINKIKDIIKSGSIQKEVNGVKVDVFRRLDRSKDDLQGDIQGEYKKLEAQFELDICYDICLFVIIVDAVYHNIENINGQIKQLKNFINYCFINEKNIFTDVKKSSEGKKCRNILYYFVKHFSSELKIKFPVSDKEKYILDIFQQLLRESDLNLDYNEGNEIIELDIEFLGSTILEHAVFTLDFNLVKAILEADREKSGNNVNFTKTIYYVNKTTFNSLLHFLFNKFEEKIVSVYNNQLQLDDENSEEGKKFRIITKEGLSVQDIRDTILKEDNSEFYQFIDTILKIMYIIMIEHYYNLIIGGVMEKEKPKEMFDLLKYENKNGQSILQLFKNPNPSDTKQETIDFYISNFNLNAKLPPYHKEDTKDVTSEGMQKVQDFEGVLKNDLLEKGIRLKILKNARLFSKATITEPYLNFVSDKQIKGTPSPISLFGSPLTTSFYKLNNQKEVFENIYKVTVEKLDEKYLEVGASPGGMEASGQEPKANTDADLLGFCFFNSKTNEKHMLVNHLEIMKFLRKAIKYSIDKKVEVDGDTLLKKNIYALIKSDEQLFLYPLWVRTMYTSPASNELAESNGQNKKRKLFKSTLKRAIAQATATPATPVEYVEAFNEYLLINNFHGAQRNPNYAAPKAEILEQNKQQLSAASFIGSAIDGSVTEEMNQVLSEVSIDDSTLRGSVQGNDGEGVLSEGSNLKANIRQQKGVTANEAIEFWAKQLPIANNDGSSDSNRTEYALARLPGSVVSSMEAMISPQLNLFVDKPGKSVGVVGPASTLQSASTEASNNNPGIAQIFAKGMEGLENQDIEKQDKNLSNFFTGDGLKFLVPGMENTDILKFRPGITQENPAYEGGTNTSTLPSKLSNFNPKLMERQNKLTENSIRPEGGYAQANSASVTSPESVYASVPGSELGNSGVSTVSGVGSELGQDVYAEPDKSELAQLQTQLDVAQKELEELKRLRQPAPNPEECQKLLGQTKTGDTYKGTVNRIVAIPNNQYDNYHLRNLVKLPEEDRKNYCECIILVAKNVNDNKGHVYTIDGWTLAENIKREIIENKVVGLTFSLGTYGAVSTNTQPNVTIPSGVKNRLFGDLIIKKNKHLFEVDKKFGANNITFKDNLPFAKKCMVVMNKDNKIKTKPSFTRTNNRSSNIKYCGEDSDGNFICNKCQGDIVLKLGKPEILENEIVIGIRTDKEYESCVYGLIRFYTKVFMSGRGGQTVCSDSKTLISGNCDEKTTLSTMQYFQPMLAGRNSLNLDCSTVFSGSKAKPLSKQVRGGGTKKKIRQHPSQNNKNQWTTGKKKRLESITKKKNVRQNLSKNKVNKN